MLRHVAMVAKFLDDNQPKIWIHRCFKPYPFDLIQFYIICQMLAKFSGFVFETTVSKFWKRKRKFFALFTYFTNWGHESRKFHVAGRATTAKKCQKKIKVIHEQRYCFANLNLLFFSPSHCCSRRCYLSSLSLRSKHFCYHGNVTSHSSSLRWLHTCDACVISTWRLGLRATLVARNNSSIMKGLKTSTGN